MYYPLDTPSVIHQNYLSENQYQPVKELSDTRFI